MDNQWTDKELAVQEVLQSFPDFVGPADDVAFNWQLERARSLINAVITSEELELIKIAKELRAAAIRSRERKEQRREIINSLGEISLVLGSPEIKQKHELLESLPKIIIDYQDFEDRLIQVVEKEKSFILEGQEE